MTESEFRNKLFEDGIDLLIKDETISDIKTRIVIDATNIKVKSLTLINVKINQQLFLTNFKLKGGICLINCYISEGLTIEGLELNLSEVNLGMKYKSSLTISGCRFGHGFLRINESLFHGTLEVLAPRDISAVFVTGNKSKSAFRFKDLSGLRNFEFNFNQIDTVQINDCEFVHEVRNAGNKYGFFVVQSTKFSQSVIIKDDEILRGISIAECEFEKKCNVRSLPGS